MVPSLHENTKKAFSKLLTGNAYVFVTSDDDFKHLTVLN